MIDVIIIGSGPSGAIAAKRLVQSGLKIATLDVGDDDTKYRDKIPDKSLSEIRNEEVDQSRYFLGENLEGIPIGNVRVGSQLTPPRQFINSLADKLLPLESSNFFPLQSLALGGIGAGWGEASFTFSQEELRKIGIEDEKFINYYEKVAEWIGISANLQDDAAPFLMQCKKNILGPLNMDKNSSSIYSQYKARAEWFRNKGFYMGSTPLAILSEDYAGRKAGLITESLDRSRSFSISYLLFP
ncbi:hypothetical protein EHQ72_12820 [Leptospira yasudae]|uniref:hypothetical protein n=1 Tax=Leptospira yasudae TaxID=2202201 RepID=UPI001090C271|nr:hypothetical protein [Leptospira yasudae]TGL76905.1 hypothetical protein EHQ72_12820 [Leptospira yasudae]